MIELREMRLEDVPQVVSIEESHCPDPWTERIFSDCIFVGYHCWVLVNGEEVVGYAILSVSDQTAHLLNIAIKENYRRQGLARRFMDKVQLLAKENAARELSLEVRISNKIAIDLYQKLGFKRVGYRKDYYKIEDGCKEDAFVFLLELE